MKDTKGYFNKLSSDLDSALQKNAAVAAKGRPSDAEDAANLLTATKSCFRYTALDYVHQISMLQSRKRHEVMDSILSAVQAHGDFFGKGQAMFEPTPAAAASASAARPKTTSAVGGGLGAFASELEVRIAGLRAESASLERRMEKRHTQVSQCEEQEGGGGTSSSSPGQLHQGYLFKRGQNAFKTWNRRWFYLQVFPIK